MALATGKLRIITNAAREVLTGGDGLATGVVCEPRRSPRLRGARPHRRAGGERVRDGAADAQLDPAGSRRRGQLERRRRPPPDRFHRLANSGHPEDEHGVPHNEDAAAGRHPTCRGGRQRGARFPARLLHRARRRTAICQLRPWAGSSASTAPAATARRPGDYRRFYGATVNFAGRGEMIPNDDTYCEIDPSVVDTYAFRCRASTPASRITR